MKDNNLEQQLADKLGNRSIAPSEQAWERIAHNRQQGRQKQKSRKRMFVYYAASIAVVLFAGYLFMTIASDTVAAPQVVDKTEKTSVATEQAVAVSESGTIPAQEGIPVTYKENAVQGVALPAYKQEVAIASQSINQPQVSENIAQLSASVLPEAKAITKDKLYDEEVDYLLKNAIKQVAADKHLSKPTDNTALLKEVEAEMDEYYRDKAMSIFSLKHKKIRIAVRE